jgi:hypothetical protein
LSDDGIIHFGETILDSGDNKKNNLI